MGWVEFGLDGALCGMDAEEHLAHWRRPALAEKRPTAGQDTVRSGHWQLFVTKVADWAAVEAPVEAGL